MLPRVSAAMAATMKTAGTLQRFRGLAIISFSLLIAYGLSPGFSPASAQPVPGMLDQVVNRFTQIQGIEAGLMAVAQNIFLSIATIETVFTVGRVVKGGADIMDVLGVLVERAVVVGFFWFVLINGGDIARSVVNTLAMAANNASVQIGGTANMSPTNTFNVGVNLAKTLWEGLSWYSPVQSLLLTIGGFICLAALVTCCALQIEVLIESKFVASATVFFLGFSGASWTRDIAISMMRASLAIGAKLLFLQMLIGGTELIFRDMAAQVRLGQALDVNTIAVLVGVPIVISYLAKTLPSKVQGIINGTYYGGGGLGQFTQGMARAATVAAVAATGVGAATTAAFREASSQVAGREAAAQQAGGGGGGTKSGLGSLAQTAGRMAQITGGAAKNFGGAMAQDMGQRLTGNYSANHGFGGFRAAAAMNARANAANEKRNQNS